MNSLFPLNRLKTFICDIRERTGLCRCLYASNEYSKQPKPSQEKAIWVGDVTTGMDFMATVF